MARDVLVVGGGGREHALVRALRRSPDLGRLFCAPGNAGIGQEAELLPLAADDLDGLAVFAAREKIDLTVVGPEAPLVAGLADLFRERGLLVFGPGADAARMEGSKTFAKEVMAAAGVPTAAVRTFGDFASAAAYVRETGGPSVVKADGLAAGKGVTVAASAGEAEAALRECFVEERFGDAGRTVLVEECLVGEELSLLALVSGESILPLAPAQDYKRIHDSDRGPNTGGMGSYSPVPSVTPAVYRDVVESVIRPTVAELRRRGIDFRGVLYAGIMLTAAGPKVLEFNVRFGDPETQALLPRLRTDLLDLLWRAAHGLPLPAEAEWAEGACVTVVLASRGYPASSSSGDVITGLAEADALPGVDVFHAGTALKDAATVTAGGRVLGVTARGAGFADARALAYDAVGRIHFPGMQYRTDIGLRAEDMERRPHGDAA